MSKTVLKIKIADKFATRTLYNRIIRQFSQTKIHSVCYEVMMSLVNLIVHE